MFSPILKIRDNKVCIVSDTVIEPVPDNSSVYIKPYPRMGKTRLDSITFVLYVFINQNKL